MNEHANQIGTNIPVEPFIDADADRQPWVEIETGRYQPQRIKGSCLGRELG